MDFTAAHKAIMPIGKLTPDGPKFLGTCFTLNKPGLFATCFHVTGVSDEGLVVFFPKGNNLNSYQHPIQSNYDFANARIIASNPSTDLCIIQVDGDARSNMRITGTDTVFTSEKLYLIGYPHVTDIRTVLTLQEATVGAKTYLYSAQIAVKHIVLNFQTRPGQSGSPIFKISNSALVGVLIGSYKSKNLNEQDREDSYLSLNSTTYAVSAEYLIGMY